MTPHYDVSSDAALVPTAWNGMHLAVPAQWWSARLGPAYWYFEDADGPAFEFKWRHDAGREGMDAAFRALTPKGRARAVERLPEAWLDALADFELMPLSWKLDGRTGLGAALFCPECGLAAVFQGYGGADGLGAGRIATLATVLASLRHHEPGPPAFQLFGLSFTPPPGFALASFDFVPGRFALSFVAGRRRLDMLRLAPADVLLSREPLAAIAASSFGFDPAAASSLTEVAGLPAVWLAERQEPGGLHGLMRILGRPGRLAVMRHAGPINKLLGMAASGRKPVDPDWLAEVAASCVSL